MPSATAGAGDDTGGGKHDPDDPPDQPRLGAGDVGPRVGDLRREPLVDAHHLGAQFGEAALNWSGVTMVAAFDGLLHDMRDIVFATIDTRHLAPASSIWRLNATHDSFKSGSGDSGLGAARLRTVPAPREH